ncbi:glycoside hydrolase family 13 protein [Lachnoclostridium sp.]
MEDGQLDVAPFCKEAVFSDGTFIYRSPQEANLFDHVMIRIRVCHNNLDEVWLRNKNQKLGMNLWLTEGLFDYFEVALEVKEERESYYFELVKGERTYYYNTDGVTEEIAPEKAFTILAGYKTPDWAKGAVFYQIFVDRFYNGDVSNDVLDNEYHYIGESVAQVLDWNKYPAVNGVREFYGGDLAGVIKKLDYLEDLGIDAIYMNPIFVSPSNHKYDIQDYDFVDPHYGVIKLDDGENLPSQNNKEATRYIKRVTSLENLEASNQLFQTLVEEAHKRGIRIILDGVFNHCGSFNKWLDRELIYEDAKGYEKGAFVSKESPYHTFFQFLEDSWPYNATYDGWWGHDTLPKLNYEKSEKLRDYIMEIAKKWVSPPFHADGWRLDVAADLGYTAEYNHQFWKEFRKAVKEANPEALILAEHYGDPSEWLQGDEWDSVMNYDAFMEPVTWFFTGMEKHSDQYREDMLSNHSNFINAMNYFTGKFQTQSLQVAMNELSNHDHSRFLTRTNRRVGRTNSVGAKEAEEGIQMAVMREAVVLQMTWPGAPTIYYGDEAGVCGWTDPDNRRTYPWGNEDKELIRLHKELIRLRKSYQALKVGSMKFLTSFRGVISYGRFDLEDQFLVLLNNNDYEVMVSVPVWEIGIPNDCPMIRMFATDDVGFAVDAKVYYPEQGELSLKLKARSSIVAKNYPKRLMFLK